MSAVVRYDGVLLRYPDDALARYHVEQKPQPSDHARMMLIAAERELVVILTIAEHLEISEIALTRICDALDTIRKALDLKRRSLGMQSPEVIE